MPYATRFLLVILLLFTFACSSANDDPVPGDGDSSSDGDSESDGNESPDGDMDDATDGDGEHDGDVEAEIEEEESVPDGLPTRPDIAPTMIVRPEDKAVILDRITRAPFDQILSEIESVAARNHVDLPPDTFDSDEQRNGETALAAAFLAWLNDDAAQAEKARDFMSQLSDNYASHTDGDINIRLPSIILGYTFALDLLVGAGLIPDDEATALENKLTTLVDAFYVDYIEDYLNLMLIHYTQNNHPIRTACSIGTAALAFPEHPEARKWADWAFSELDYLWGPEGQYVQADGGVSEGSLYYRFAFAPSLALFHAWHNRIGTPRMFSRNCVNRIDQDPWADYVCTDGEPFVFNNPLFEERFQLSVDWFLNLRMPDGRRPPMEDSSFKDGNGGAIMARYMDRPDLVWDWHTNNLNMDGGMDLRIQHLAYAPELPDAQPPEWTHRVMPIAGQAVFRTGWESDALWVMMTAEHGSARKTVHDHVDGGSYTLHAYGEYLLMDTGYYKPNMATNAVTAHARAHNLLMIAEEPVPGKGLLTNFGDADAFLENEALSDNLAYVEARQPIDITTTTRHLALVRNRYVADVYRLETSNTELRHHTWRMHGYAGMDEVGSFALEADHALWERPAAGVAVYLGSTAPGLTIEAPPYEEGQAPYVHKIEGDEHHHGVMDGVIEAVKPGFVSVAIPYRVGAADGATDALLPVTALEVDGVSEGVAGWWVDHGAGRDLLLLREASAPTALTVGPLLTLDTDAEMVILGLDESDAPEFVLIARGSYVKWQEAMLIENATEPVTLLDPGSGMPPPYDNETR